MPIRDRIAVSARCAREVLVIEGVTPVCAERDQVVPYQVGQRDRGVEIVRARHGARPQLVEKSLSQLGR